MNQMQEGNGSSEEVLKAQALLWSHMFNHIDTMCLKCAVELGIPDAISNHGGPIALPDLLSALSLSHAKAPFLRRLMAKLSHSGFFTVEEEEEAYSLTPLSTLLVRDSDVSQSQLILAILHPVIVNPFAFMSAWFRSGTAAAATPFDLMHGCGFWEMTDRDLKFNNAFNEGMASDARLLMSVLLKDCGHVFRGISSLVDVGGGTGSAAKAIVAAFPEMECSVLELSQVVDSVVEKGDTVNFVAGDMFEYIPPADAIMLKWILHDWTDKDCVKILQNCKKAVPSKEAGGKIIVIDSVVGSNTSLPKCTEAQLSFDIMMMVLCRGLERGEEEWKNIFFEAGFSDYKITPALGLRSVIELYP